MATASGPLNDSHCQTIDCTLERIHELRQLLDKCERCGLPCDSVRDELNARQARLEAYKREFFPDRR